MKFFKAKAKLLTSLTKQLNKKKVEGTQAYMKKNHLIDEVIRLVSP